ncbi:MAG: tRNA lysidine(34) synthetase TilS [Candidatus Binatia bacterium]
MVAAANIPVRRTAPRLISALAAALDDAIGPRRGEHLLVAVSGGPDSTALAAGLAELAPARGLALTLAHVDHGLRGAEGAHDRAHVEALAARLAAPCEVRAVAVTPGPNLEARARRARYRALADVAATVGAQRIVTAHTQDDQVETLLLRLLRGTGRRGLGAMRVRRGRLWRPLLDTTRVDVRHFLALRNLPAVIDRTNAELRFTRNRVRRVLIPLLAAEFNPRIGPQLAALAARMQDEEELLAREAASRASALGEGERLAVGVAAEPRALGRRIVRTWLAATTRRLPSAGHVERVLALAGAGRPGAIAVPGPARVVREGAWLVCRPGRDPDRTRLSAWVAPGETFAHPAGLWALHVSAPGPRTADVLAGATPARAVFDADALPDRLLVRSPAPGDRIHVAGVGTRKVQDVLVDARVPRETRPSVPLVLAGEVVVWVAGVTRGSVAAVTPQTQRVITVVFERRALPQQ